MSKKSYLIGLVVIFLTITLINWRSGLTAEEPPATPTSSIVFEVKEIDQVENAVLSKIHNIQSERPTQPILRYEFDNIRITDDTSYSTGWIIRKDSETGEVIPSEPGVFIGERKEGDWEVYLSTDPVWKDIVRNSPQELISVDEKNRLLGMDVDFGKITKITTDGGYLLPWAEGLAVNLSRSVSHDEDFPSGNAHYSFDFYIPQTMFNLYAAKAGTVWAFKDTVPNNDHSDVNFLVLRNADNPDLYQLYLHLAQNSIPPSLKTIGAQAIQGQFVGIADNTGASTGHHLHFQVQTQPYWPVDNPYWGKSVDITFEEVEIYGGRPRRANEYDEGICGGYCEDGLLTYVSANILKGDLTPPIGDFSGVTMGQIVETNTLLFSGWGSDADSGLYSGQLRALYNGSWYNLGDTFGNNFTYTWDLCAVNNPVPKGVVSVGLRLYDWDGNWADYAGLKHFIKKVDCPQAQPICVPSADQITLYEDSDYRGGCVVFNIGQFPDAQALGSLGNNDAAAIKVGSSVQGTLYSEENYQGHSETFTTNDNNFIDNLIGLDTLSSLKVSLRTGNTGTPIITGPPSGVSFSELDLIPLSWENGNNSIDYQVRYTLNGGATIDLPWQKYTYLHMGGLIPGSYSWEVRGRNSAGVAGVWSSAATFNINSPSSSPPAINAPYTDDMESSEDDWSSSGLWEIKDDAGMSHSGTHSWWYQNSDGDYDIGVPNYGGLTSPPINIPSIGYYLRFWYRYETETKGIHWDQRWLQISVNGNPFTNLIQLHDDPQIYETSSWLQSMVIDLSEYAGQTIRIRFQFASMDASLNEGRGWGIDDFSITDTPPVVCDENREDDTIQQAYELSYSETAKIQAEICPGGDYDYYKFYGMTGEQIVIDIDAQTIDSPLDSYLILIDSDGNSILAEHDDEVYAERRDPLLSYILPHDGLFYIKVRAWKHPSVGDSEHEYTIRLYEDNNDPFAYILIPTSDSYIPVDPFEVTAQIKDAVDGISHVDFAWHDYDWVIPAWDDLGTDWDASDGWKINFDPSGLLERDGGAIRIDAYDKAGNLTIAGVWNIGVDLTPPSTDLQPLEVEQLSSALLLVWNGFDNGSGLKSSNLQYKLDGGAWQNYPDEIYNRQSWFIGNPGHNYDFRIRGIDRAGNIEEFPVNAQANTRIPDADVLCSAPDLYDEGDGDNTAAQSSNINPDGGKQVHNFCNPHVSDRLNDEDWMKFSVRDGIRYLIQAVPTQGNVGAVMELYAEDTTTLIKSGESPSFGQLANLVWTSDRNGEIYLRVRHLDGRVIGNVVEYSIIIGQGYHLYFPLLRK